MARLKSLTVMLVTSVDMELALILLEVLGSFLASSQLLAMLKASREEDD